MDLSAERFDEVVHLLYESVETPHRWKSLFDLIAKSVCVSTVHLFAFDKKHGCLSYSEGSNIPVDGELAYLQKYCAIDPRFARILTKEVGEWMHCHLEFDEDYVSKNVFFQDFLIPLGRRYASACKLLDDEQAIIFFCLVRDVGDVPLGEGEIAFAEKLTPHLQRAVRMQLQKFVFSTKALVGHALVNRLKQPVMLVTTEGSVVLANDAAGRLLASTGLIATTDGKLSLPTAVMHQFYEKCAYLEGLVKTGDTASPELNAYQTLIIEGVPKGESRNKEKTLYGFFNMLSPEQVGGTFGLRPLVMLLLFDPDSAPAIDSNLLLAAFNLTPAESRLCQMLADGDSLKEIAIKIGVQHETIRKQLQSVYRKTATNRQSSLMKLMLNLPENVFSA